jgi:ABC-2 type transport system permease protein
VFLVFLSYTSQTYGKSKLEERLAKGEKILLEDHTKYFSKDTSSSFLFVDSLDESLKQFKEGNFLGGLVIPDDYFKTGRVRLIIPHTRGVGSRSSFQKPVESFLRRELLRNIEKTEHKERIFNTLRFELFTLNPSGEITPYDYHRLVVPVLFMILFVLFQSTASTFLLQSVSEEKENRTIEILLSSLRDTQLIAGKVLGLGAAALVQVLTWTVMAVTSFSTIGKLMNIPLEFGKIPSDHLIFGALSFTMGFLIFAALMIGIGSMAANYKDAQQLSAFFVIASLLPIYVLQIILEELHGPLATFLNFFPLTAPLVMTTRYCLADLSWLEIIASLATQALFMVFFVWLSARLFRIGTLMYNRRPSLKEIRSALLRI